TRFAGLASILSAKSVMDAPRRRRTTVPPSPRGTETPPIDGASRISNSARFVRFDLRDLLLPPPRPNAPAVPPPGPRPRPPPPPGRGGPKPGAPPGPRGRKPPPAPGAPGRAGRPAPAPARPAAAGRGAPGRGEPGRGAAGRGMLEGVGRDCIPCVDAYGLLPGRGAPG